MINNRTPVIHHFLIGWLDDYRPDAMLDQYDTAQLDDREVDQNLDMYQRRELEDDMDRRDALERDRRRRVSNEGDVVDDGYSLGDRSDGDSEDEDGAFLDDDAVDVNLEAFDVPLREWIAQGRTRRAIMSRFRNFLLHYGKQDLLYPQQIRTMCAANSASLPVSYVHLGEKVPTLAIWLADAPQDMLQIFNEVAKEVIGNTPC